MYPEDKKGHSCHTHASYRHIKCRVYSTVYIPKYRQAQEPLIYRVEKWLLLRGARRRLSRWEKNTYQETKIVVEKNKRMKM
jgi:hypothetical protein